MDDEKDDQWRKLVNRLPHDLPEDGAKAPSIENIPQKQLRDGETPVTLQKIITEVYVYTSLSNPTEIWFASESSQNVYLLGNMRLAEAEKIIQTVKNRRKTNKKDLT